MSDVSSQVSVVRCQTFGALENGIPQVGLLWRAIPHACSLKAAQRGLRGPQAHACSLKAAQRGVRGPQAPEKICFSLFLPASLAKRVRKA